MKGYAGSEKIIYDCKPKKIELVELDKKYCCCDNCASYGEHRTFVLKFNKTDYVLPNGTVGKNRYAKPRELWLCEYCLDQLKKALKEVK